MEALTRLQERWGSYLNSLFKGNEVAQLPAAVKNGEALDITIVRIAGFFIIDEGGFKRKLLLHRVTYDLSCFSLCGGSLEKAWRFTDDLVRVITGHVRYVAAGAYNGEVFLGNKNSFAFFKQYLPEIPVVVPPIRLPKAVDALCVVEQLHYHLVPVQKNIPAQQRGMRCRAGISCMMFRLADHMIFIYELQVTQPSSMLQDGALKSVVMSSRLFSSPWATTGITGSISLSACFSMVN